jgi:O-antigen/teichoic acid export membrane protein
MDDQQKRGTTGITLLKGAALLGIAAIVSKLLGTLQKIPLQNIAGDEVFGIYNAVYPLYILILTLATAGLPIAVSKFVAERVILGQYHEARRVLRIATWVLLGTGFVCFCLLFFAADWLAWLIGIKSSSGAIRSVSFALLLVPFMAALRGYFQGLHNMLPTAISQMFEQLIRVIVMVVLLVYFTRFSYNVETVAAGATFGSSAGAAAGCIIMLYYWRQEVKNRHELNVIPLVSESASSIIIQFVRYALPICLGAIVLPILNLVDTFTMPRLLKSAGLDDAAAMHLFGIYNHGLPLVQLVSMIAISMSVALVPSIAEAKMKQQNQVIRNRTELALRLTWLVGLAASFGLAAAALPLNVMLYASAEGWQTISILAFTAVFSALNIVSGSILQGFGSVMAPARNLLIAAGIKIILNVLLMPIYGIQGAAISAVVAFAAACLLNLRDLRRSTQAGLSLIQFMRPFLAILAMCAVLWASMKGLSYLGSHGPLQFSYRIQETVVVLLSILFAALTYLAVLLRSGVVSKEDLNRIPGFSSKALTWLHKLHLLK